MSNKARGVDALSPRALRRSLTLPLLILYGLGVTIGAGVYVLIGATVARAEAYTPAAFVIAAAVMGLSGSSFAELASRLPHSAGEAAYVKAAFGSKALTLLTGILVLVVSVVSAAAIAKGAGGYLNLFVPLSPALLTLIVIGALGAIAAYGTSEAVSVAAAMTLIEIGGLLAIILTSAVVFPDEMWRVTANAIPKTTSLADWRGIIGAFMLAFFAFIGFESIVNLAEETHAPHRLIPRAIGWTLVISTAIYVLVVAAAIASVSIEDLARSSAPLGLVFERTVGASPRIISAIAVFATINGVIAQIILAARVIYGLARQGSIPALFGHVHETSQTPTIATALATGLVLILASIGRLEQLADTTTRLMLLIFLLVNASLIVIKRRRDPAPVHAYVAPMWIPLAGAAACFGLLAVDFLL